MLAGRIKAVREALQLSQREFGEKLGVSRDVISNIEYERVLPKALFLQHLCQQFGINGDWLETGEGEMFIAYAKPENKMDEVLAVFKSLKPAFQDCALEQMKKLVDLQNKN